MKSLSTTVHASTNKALILAILAKRKESYGYEIIKLVLTLSDGAFQWKDGMLYPVLHRMEKDGLVASRWRLAENGRKRKYYRITDEGVRALVGPGPGDVHPAVPAQGGGKALFSAAPGGLGGIPPGTDFRGRPGGGERPPGVPERGFRPSEEDLEGGEACRGIHPFRTDFPPPGGLDFEKNTRPGRGLMVSSSPFTGEGTCRSSRKNRSWN